MSTDPTTSDDSDKGSRLDFIREIIRDDLASGKHPYIVTRFPPEPNGYLHIGHTKAFSLNFSVPGEFPGSDGKSRCHLRMDDTNPVKEDTEYVESIQEDIRWLGYDWGDDFYFASDYYQQLYEWALELIDKDLAYIDSQTADEIREGRGTLTEPGSESPFRDRPKEESRDIFERMKAGEFEDGTHVLRAKIDMSHPNLNMRDPVMYRILHAHHHRTGDDWCIYPLYDFAHPLSDAIEGITHSLCSLEFEHHRPLYDWFVEHCSVPHVPRQIEFARLSLNYTVMSKRKLQKLVAEGLVDGWDDPRMPTLSGMRRRGYTPEAIKNFIQTVGLTKVNSVTDVALLEHAVREDLNKTSPRAMAVLRPLKLTITDWPEGKVLELEAVNNPEDPDAGTRIVPFTGELYIEQDDFMEDAPKKFFRLKPGGEVRLRSSYVIRCDEVIKNDAGEVVELRCSHDPDTLGKAPEGRKVKGVIHWVSAEHAVDADVHVYDRLFSSENPEAAGDFVEDLNPNSREILTNCKLEPALAAVAEPGYRCQFERLGYFCADLTSSPAKPIFNRTVALLDTWAKVQAKK